MGFVAMVVAMVPFRRISPSECVSPLNMYSPVRFSAAQER